MVQEGNVSISEMTSLNDIERTFKDLEQEYNDFINTIKEEVDSTGIDSRAFDFHTLRLKGFIEDKLSFSYITQESRDDFIREIVKMKDDSLGIPESFLKPVLQEADESQRRYEQLETQTLSIGSEMTELSQSLINQEQSYSTKLGELRSKINFTSRLKSQFDTLTKSYASDEASSKLIDVITDSGVMLDAQEIRETLTSISSTVNGKYIQKINGGLYQEDTQEDMEAEITRLTTEADYFQAQHDKNKKSRDDELDSFETRTANMKLAQTLADLNTILQRIVPLDIKTHVNTAGHTCITFTSSDNNNTEIVLDQELNILPSDSTNLIPNETLLSLESVPISERLPKLILYIKQCLKEAPFN